MPSTGRVVPLRTVSLPEVIEKERRRKRSRRLIWLSVGVASLLAVGLGAWAARPRPAPISQRFRTGSVTHGTITREVLATGHVEAVATVLVGAEISGRVATVEVDFNDRVKAGQVLARFDQGALEAQRTQALAMAAASRAQLAQAKADLEQARRTLTRADDLFARGAQTTAEHEAAVTAVRLGTARVEASSASVAAQEAQATLAKTNLDHAIIRSPIDGVVITRTIDPGQTVASMLQTPTLFTVAADLRKMEVVAAVDEADISEAKEGQRATFTVTSAPGRTYDARVTEVRNSARIVQEVVTYGVVVEVDNLDLSLKPGMTASVRVQTGQVTDVDRVPNAALSFTPPQHTRGDAPGVFVLDGEQLVFKPVSPGLSDGELTAIGPGQLDPAAKVLVDLTPEGKKAYGLVPAR